MKRIIAICATALLVFAVWFGWQRYAEHKRAIEQWGFLGMVINDS
jgi:predicted negative regulator of RcsB-dependent stress response